MVGFILGIKLGYGRVITYALIVIILIMIILVYVRSSLFETDLVYQK